MKKIDMKKIRTECPGCKKVTTHKKLLLTLHNGESCDVGWECGECYTVWDYE